MFIPMTNWQSAVGYDDIKAALNLRSVQVASGGLEAQLAIQTATVRTDEPDNWATVSGLTQSGAGATGSAAISVANTTAAKMWVRFGLAYNLTAGSTAPGAADATLALSYAACGSLIGAWNGQLTTTVTSDSYVAITPMIPALLADKIKAAIIVNSVTSNFQCRVVVRYGFALKEVAGAWTNTSDTNVSGASQRNTGELTLSNGSNMYVQIGLAYSNTSAVFAQADVAVSVGARRT
ncbi:MAG: hypothetical protein V4850_21135 [Myxococcota bacterium]